MLFRLKNAEAIYQRLMNKVFTNQIGRIMEVYIDDMVAKTMENGDHGEEIQHAFEIEEMCIYSSKGEIPWIFTD